MKQTFLEFLAEEAKHQKIQKPKKPKPPKPRPPKNLWFNNPDFWHNDLYIEKGHEVKYYEDEEQNVYATDMNGEQCFGYWEKANHQGITFHKPRPLSMYQHRRMMKEMK